MDPKLWACKPDCRAPQPLPTGKFPGWKRIRFSDHTRTAAEAQQLHDYLLGQKAGRCLVARCPVFTGYLLTEFLLPGASVEVQIEESLYTTDLQSLT